MNRQIQYQELPGQSAIGRCGIVPPVTPAQAGVQAAFFWIPAFAGMTDAGVRRNDGPDARD